MKALPRVMLRMVRDAKAIDSVKTNDMRSPYAMSRALNSVGVVKTKEPTPLVIEIPYFRPGICPRNSSFLSIPEIFQKGASS